MESNFDRNQKLESLTPTMREAAKLGARVAYSSWNNEPIALVLGDDSEIKAARARFMEDTKEWDSRSRNEHLCLQQRTNYREYGYKGGSPWQWSVGTNIYGFAAGCMMKSNLQGGRFAATPRGITLAEACDFAAKKALEGGCQTASISLSNLSAKALAEALALAAGR